MIKTDARQALLARGQVSVIAEVEALSLEQIFDSFSILVDFCVDLGVL